MVPGLHWKRVDTKEAAHRLAVGMSEEKLVKLKGPIEPASVTCWNPIWPWQYIFGKPWTITCGRCQWTWRKRLPVAEHVTVECPMCGGVNAWDGEIG